VVLIELAGAEKHYQMGETLVRAIDGISLKINRGDFAAIMGPSGSGKSTALNLVGSLDLPTKGAVYLDSRNISQLDESQLAQIRGQKIGFIFQSFNLIANLTAKENVMLPLLFQGASSEERQQKAQELLQLVNLTDRMGHYPNQLSGGQQQRVAIARALANDPEIILADEPTGNLDTQAGEQVMAFLQELNRRGKTIILVTHDRNLARNHAKIIYSMKDGKIEKITKKINHKWEAVS